MYIIFIYSDRQIDRYIDLMFSDPEDEPDSMYI